MQLAELSKNIKQIFSKHPISIQPLFNYHNYIAFTYLYIYIFLFIFIYIFISFKKALIKSAYKNQYRG